MPIRGLSDQRRISRAGYLRCGEMAKNAEGREYPTKLDHFKADFADRELEKRFCALYGPQPKRVSVTFPPGPPESWFPQWYYSYGKGQGLKCKGDGETAGRVVNGEIVEVPCPGPETCAFAKRNGCKRVGRLQFFVKGLPRLQVVQVNTSGRNSIINLNSGIELLIGALGGRSHFGVYVDLVLKPDESSVDGSRRRFYSLDIEIPMGLEDIQRLQTSGASPMALPQPSEERDQLLHPENGFDAEPEVDPVTGEVLDSLDDDAIDAAFEGAGIAGPRKEAILASAASGDWSREQLLAVIAKQKGSQRHAGRVRTGSGNGRGKEPVMQALDPADEIDF